MFLKKFLIIPLVLTMFLFLVALTTTSSSSLPGPGKKFEDFTLKDYKGENHSLSDYSGSKAIVIMFIATKCPVSNAYNSRMEKIYEEYKEKGVSFLGINSNKAEDVDEIAEHAIDNGLTFTILKDEMNVIADVFEASYTPEIYVLSNEFELLYHGRIDNSKRESDVSVTDLANTLDEILSGREVSTPETKAFGCSIKRI